MSTGTIHRRGSNDVMKCLSTKTLVCGVLLGACFVCAGDGHDASYPAIDIISSELIWDRAPHNAFTDIINYKNKWYVSFREGKSHGSMDGRARILQSTDGEEWVSVANFMHKGVDLRDPKLTITPDGRLMAGVGARFPNDERQPMVWFTEDGETWTQGKAVGERNVWMWDFETRGDWIYSFGYRTDAYRPKPPRNRYSRFVRLYRSKDGLVWEQLTDIEYGREYINETAFDFASDGTMYALMRSDSGPKEVRVGVSEPPYTEWTWKSTAQRMGGPTLNVVKDKWLLGGGRVKTSSDRKTIFFWVAPETAGLEEAVVLPSTHECGYPAMHIDDEGMIWVSYYSSQSGKTGIYVAKLRLEQNGL